MTKRERGIPLHLLDKIIQEAGFIVAKRALCNFPLVPKLATKVGVSAYNNRALTVADALLSRLFIRNIDYHRTKWTQKMGPASAFYVLSK